MTNFTDVLNYVGQEATIEEIRGLFDAGNARIKVLRALKDAEASATLKPGDKVTISGLSPKYLNGLTGEVAAIDRSRRKVSAVIKLDDKSAITAGSRYAFAGMMRGVPLGCLTVSE